MNIDKLKEELKIDEGVKYEIYRDHLGFPTFGIGHLIVDTDIEYGQPVGTKVTEDRVNECFVSDTSSVLKDCETLFSSYYDLPEEVQLIIANMMFNMGKPRMSGFKKFIAAIEDGDWSKAAKEMIDSKWYRQVTNRAERLVNRMRSI
jgi:lysozyme